MQGDEIQHAPSLNLFQHASWQGIRKENLVRKKSLLVLANDLSNTLSREILDIIKDFVSYSRCQSVCRGIAQNNITCI